MYLGHLITEDGVKPDPKKISAIADYPQIKNAKDVRAFLGLAGYYRRFIPNFSALSQPLTKLLRKDTTFNWTSLQQNAFETLRNILITEPLLQYPKFEEEFNLSTDASNYAIGAVLSQGKMGQDKPIAYASRTLNRAESNYSTVEKELLAIIWSVKHFRHFLYGRKFKIFTDHRPLTWLFNAKDPSSRLVRWRLLLEEYDYNIEYRPGVRNQVADALSRIEDHQGTSAAVNTLHSIQRDPSYSDFLKASSTSLITYENLTENDEALTNTPGNFVTCIAEDLLIEDKPSSELLSKFHHREKIQNLKPKIRDIHFFQEDKSFVFYMVLKEFHWNQGEYETLLTYWLNLGIFVTK
ncbi:hypothetical protein HHI36_002701 [Cryptolaemus montrouzieri]|uniref:Reverse transcriptase RNase H-like domain-containing protein n=1 Tax=Cryptolaemus montrouzieri TaxID=559131 RepID=A0ABD2PC27_9CUCU